MAIKVSIHQIFFTAHFKFFAEFSATWQQLCNLPCGGGLGLPSITAKVLRRAGSTFHCLCAISGHGEQGHSFPFAA